MAMASLEDFNWSKSANTGTTIGGKNQLSVRGKTKPSLTSVLAEPCDALWRGMEGGAYTIFRSAPQLACTGKCARATGA